MNNTLYTIYWMFNGHADALQTYDMIDALREMEAMRKTSGFSAVTFCSENTDQVGKNGVDSVKDGKLPDGQEYVYKTGRDRGRDPR